MSVAKSRKKEEAIKRLEVLTKTLDLNSNILKYFKEDKLYYSYTTCNGFIGSIDTISYVADYEELVKNFENDCNCLVYHVVEDNFGMLSFFYVSDYEEDWVEQQPEGKFVPAYILSFDKEKLKNGTYEVQYQEYGEIICSSMGGAVIRVG